MNDDDNNRIDDGAEPEAELSPSEKLDKENPDSSRIPGAQNPDSEAIKGEINPNTE